MTEGLAIVGFLVLLPLVVAAVRWASARWNLPAEVRRKAVHIGMGLSALSFPWVFDSTWSVAILGALCLGMLRLIRLRERRAGEGMVSVLHGVGRASLGDAWFPLAVVIVFALARRHEGVEGMLLYVVPVLILTVADAAGALVGTRYGVHSFSCLSGWKSVEGCLSFFFGAFFSSHVPLLLWTDTGRAECLLIATILGLTVMLFEAISTRGIDNLIVPVAAALLLERFLPMEGADLAWRLALVSGLLLFVFACRKWTSLEGGALLAAVLFGYGSWVLGDWRFLVPPVLLFLEHLVVTHRLRRVWQPRHDLTPILGIGLSLLPWAALAAWHPEWREVALAGFVTGTAAHLSMTNLATRAFVAGRCPDGRMKRLAWAKGVCVIALPGWWLVEGEMGRLLAGLGLAAVLVRLTVGVFVRLSGKRDAEAFGDEADRWWRQGAAAFLAGGVAVVAARNLFLILS